MKSVVITLKREEIMSDVVNAAHVVGRRLMAVGNEEKAADIQTPEESVDKYIVARAMAAGLSALREKCARYLTSGRLADDNTLEDVTGNYELTLSMPERWNFGATTRLTTRMHDYVANYCVYNIFEKTNPEEAANYLSKAASDLDGVKAILELRTAPVRKDAENLY